MVKLIIGLKITIINYLLSKQVVSLSDSTYSIIICNPVQYQTSIPLFNKR